MSKSLFVDAVPGGELLGFKLLTREPDSVGHLFNGSHHRHNNQPDRSPASFFIAHFI